MCCCACWPTTSSGTCGGRWRRCCSTITTRPAAEQQRPSVVAAARRSPAACAKAGRKRTADDLPVHSFRTLLSDLGTLTANTMQLAEGGATFRLQTQPTPLQQRCFELLAVTPRM